MTSRESRWNVGHKSDLNLLFCCSHVRYLRNDNFNRFCETFLSWILRLFVFIIIADASNPICNSNQNNFATLISPMISLHFNVTRFTINCIINLRACIHHRCNKWHRMLPKKNLIQQYFNAKAIFSEKKLTMIKWKRELNGFSN